MDYWNDLQEITDLLTKISSPAMQQAAEMAGYPNNEWRGWLLPAYILSPNPIDPATLRIRSAYTNPTFFSKLLINQAKQGNLLEENDGYLLSPSSQKTAKSILASARKQIRLLPEQPQDLISRLVQLLKRVLFACGETEEPHSKWCLNHNHDPIVVDTQPGIIQLDQILSDLAAWRDDCHLGAWQPYHYLQGYAWEFFTLVWVGDAHRIDDICQKLSVKRGFSAVVYQTALEELKLRGWLFCENEHVYLTTAGAKSAS